MSEQPPLVVLVTGAGGPLGVNLARSLRQAKGPFRLVGTDANRWHLPLSICDITYQIPPARAGEAYGRALVEICQRERVDVLVPTHPVEVRAVASLHERAGLPALLCLPRLSVLEMADDKVATQRRLFERGLAVPRTVVLAAPQDVDRAFAELVGGHSGALWVRGSGAPGLGIGGAALPCREPAVAKAWVTHCKGWGLMSASEFLPGANLTWMAVFAEGQLMAAGSRERLEYVLPHVAPSGITGAPAVSRTLRRPELAAMGERAVRAIDHQPHGAYFVDFKEDPGGVPRITEINAGRCGTTIHFYTRAGCNFPELLVRIAAGQAPPPLAEPNKAVAPNLYWVRTLDCGPELVRGDRGFDDYPHAPR